MVVPHKTQQTLSAMIIKIVTFIKKIISQIALLLFPSLCAYCKSFLNERTVLCMPCKFKVFPIVSTEIDITQNSSVTVFALSDYKDPLKKLILAKYRFDQLASIQLGKLMQEKLATLSLSYDLIVPIPLYWTRYAHRGFNQAEEMAKVIASSKKIPVIHLLKRNKKTLFQAGLSSTLRAKNVKSAFTLNKNLNTDYSQKTILLVDDLMTTGSTIKEATKTLLSLKPKKIIVLVACRVI